MTNAIATTGKEVVQALVTQGVITATLSGRSISFISKISTGLLCAAAVFAVAAVAIQVFILLFPATLVTLPLLGYSIVLILGGTAITSIIGALAIQKLTPEKKLETNIADLQFQVDAKLPALLQQMSVDVVRVKGAIERVDEENKELTHTLERVEDVTAQALRGIKEGHGAIQHEVKESQEHLDQNLAKEIEVGQHLQELAKHLPTSQEQRKVIADLHAELERQKTVTGSLTAKLEKVAQQESTLADLLAQLEARLKSQAAH